MAAWGCISDNSSTKIARHARWQGGDCQGKARGTCLGLDLSVQSRALNFLGIPCLTQLHGRPIRPHAAMPADSYFYKASGEQV